VPRLTQDAAVAAFERQGLRFKRVTVSVEGDYRVDDADWNVKDLVHLNHVHRWANDVSGLIEKDLRSSVNLQRVLGIPFPVVLTHYQTAPDRQTHFFTAFGWVVVSELHLEQVSPGRTRVTTTYAVGGNRFWMLLFPVMAWLIKRNFRELMVEDVPMRERRGLLRTWGYTFRGDGEPADFRASLAIERDNVVIPGDPAAVPVPETVPVPEEADGWTLLGRTDHLGLRLRRRGDRLEVYPRLCPHEGAALDDAPVEDGCLTCPWHGRRLDALGTLDLTATSPALETDHLEVRVEGGKVAVRPRT